MPLSVPGTRVDALFTRDRSARSREDNDAAVLMTNGMHRALMVLCAGGAAGIVTIAVSQASSPAANAIGGLARRVFLLAGVGGLAMAAWEVCRKRD